MRQLPLLAGTRGLRIGLFGGSFNPPHQGHRDVADTARKRLALDQVWWLVSLKNPLKPAHIIDEFSERVAETRLIANRPTDRVVTIEKELGTGITVEVLRALAPALRLHHPIWIMGSDSFAGLHRWRAPREIMHRLPLAIIARPDHTLRALNAPMAREFARVRLKQQNPAPAVDKAPPCWVALPMRWNEQSSTTLRQWKQAD
jgi:nicotinate-nucleotide adenylyltransferase